MKSFPEARRLIARSRPVSGRHHCFIAVVLGSLITSAGAGQTSNSQPTGKSAALVLFDGKSLGGWKSVDFHGAGVVNVENGAIVMSAGRSMTGITNTRKDLPKMNYELSYEAMRLSGQDFFAAATFPVGSSFITLVNGGWGGNVTGFSSLDGIDASENDTGQFVKYHDKTWYKFRVRVTGEVIRSWIDDKELISANIQDRRISTRIEMRRNQPLGFATWETSGTVRNISIRPLTAAEVVVNNKLNQQDR
jgi:Domain of Unknown Function (DUF1080)